MTGNQKVDQGGVKLTYNAHFAQVNPAELSGSLLGGHVVLRSALCAPISSALSVERRPCGQSLANCYGGAGFTDKRAAKVG